MVVVEARFFVNHRVAVCVVGKVARFWEGF